MPNPELAVGVQLKIIQGKIRQLPVNPYFKNSLLNDLRLALRYYKQRKYQYVLDCLGVITDKLQTRSRWLACMPVDYGQLLASLHQAQQSLLASAQVICEKRVSPCLTYAYIYNQGAQAIPPGEAVIFSNNGSMAGDLSHPPGTAQITINSAGDYAVWFYIADGGSNQFTLFLNNSPVPGATYGTAVDAPNAGWVILSAVPGDILTLRNQTSFGTVTLPANIGGIESSVNAAILIMKVSGFLPIS